MASGDKNNKHKQASYFRGLCSLSTYTFTGLITVFLLTAGIAPAMAADSTAAANTAQSPLKSSTNPDIVRTLTLLRKQTEANVTTRIIVGLRIAFTPEGRLTAAAAAQQREEIAGLQAAVLEKVPSLKQRPEQVKRYQNIPYMALEVNATELETLAGLAEIASIEGDKLAVPNGGTEMVKPESSKLK